MKFVMLQPTSGMSNILLLMTYCSFISVLWSPIYPRFCKLIIKKKKKMNVSILLAEPLNTNLQVPETQAIVSAI